MRRKSPRKTPKKTARAAAAGPVNLDNPLINAGLSVALVVGLSAALSGIPTSISGCLGILSLSGLDTGPLHATWWPFSLLLTLHVLNSCKSNGKWWANDVTNCCFNTFGGLMVQDALKGDFSFPTLFADGEAKLSLVLVCWYFTNHDFPVLEVNLYRKATGFIGRYIPLSTILGLCSTVFNASLLLAVASTTSSVSGWALIPFAWGKLMYSCVFVHCAAQFYSPKGFSYNLGASCSKRAYEAFLVALWYGSDGLAALPWAGQYLGKASSTVEDLFGGRDAMVMTLFVLEALFGELLPLGAWAQAAWHKVYYFFNIKY